MLSLSLQKQCFLVRHLLFDVDHFWSSVYHLNPDHFGLFSLFAVLADWSVALSFALAENPAYLVLTWHHLTKLGKVKAGFCVEHELVLLVLNDWVHGSEV